MKQQIIGIDIDGVLANFNKAYREKLIEVTGRDLIPEECCRGSKPGEEPPVWNYAPHFGYTKAEDSATWKAITESTEFWYSLDKLPQTGQFLWKLGKLQGFFSRPNEYYFITTRPGVQVKHQSERWLAESGAENPTVLITRGHKGELASGLGLTHFIDDKPENCIDVKNARPECEVFLLSCKYNKAQHAPCVMRGIRVIRSLREFEKALLADAGKVAA